MIHTVDVTEHILPLQNSLETATAFVTFLESFKNDGDFENNFLLGRNSHLHKFRKIFIRSEVHEWLVGNNIDFKFKALVDQDKRIVRYLVGIRNPRDALLTKLTWG